VKSITACEPWELCATHGMQWKPHAMSPLQYTHSSQLATRGLTPPSPQALTTPISQKQQMVKQPAPFDPMTHSMG